MAGLAHVSHIEEAAFSGQTIDSMACKRTSASGKSAAALKKKLAAKGVVSKKPWSAYDSSEDDEVSTAYGHTNSVDECGPSSSSSSIESDDEKEQWFDADSSPMQSAEVTLPQSAEEVADTAQKILAELSSESFDVVFAQLAACWVRTPEQTDVIVREVFQKAASQHELISMCADLCMRLESETPLWSRTSACNAGKCLPGAAGIFRGALYQQTQDLFEDILKSDANPRNNMVDDELRRPEVDEARKLRKQRMVGNVQLTGQLLVQGLLPSLFLITCCEELLEGLASVPLAPELLVHLLTIAGPAFDNKRTWALHSRLDAIFVQIKELIARKFSCSITPKERIQLRKLLEQREKWLAASAVALEATEAAPVTGSISIDKGPKRRR